MVSGSVDPFQCPKRMAEIRKPWVGFPVELRMCFGVKMWLRWFIRVMMRWIKRIKVETRMTTMRLMRMMKEMFGMMLK